MWACTIFSGKSRKLEALPAIQTWTANCKCDHMTVVTWHSQVWSLQFPHEKPDAKGLYFLIYFQVLENAMGEATTLSTPQDQVGGF